jgi:hypothetical protein
MAGRLHSPTRAETGAHAGWEHEGSQRHGAATKRRRGDRRMVRATAVCGGGAAAACARVLQARGRPRQSLPAPLRQWRWRSGPKRLPFGAAGGRWVARWSLVLTRITFEVTRMISGPRDTRTRASSARAGHARPGPQTHRRPHRRVAEDGPHAAAGLGTRGSGRHVRVPQAAQVAVVPARRRPTSVHAMGAGCNGACAPPSECGTRGGGGSEGGGGRCSEVGSRRSVVHGVGVPVRDGVVVQHLIPMR